MKKLLLVIAFAALPAVALAQPHVIGYYPMWTRTSIPAALVKFNYLTHINHAFAWPNADGSIAYGETFVDTALIHTAHRAGRKVFLSYGGAGSVQTANFATVAADTGLRRTFISGVVAHLSAYGYDGADLDWEGPQSRNDRANEIALVREMYAAFRNADTSWRITMAIGPTGWSGQWHDFDSLRQYVGWFNAMTYDFHGSWSAHAGHNAPLYAPGSDAGDGSVDQGMQYLHVTRGIPASQIVLGLPFYGRDFQASALYGPKTEPTLDMFYQSIPGRVAGGWTYVWDVVSQVPYLTNPGGTILTTFDDTVSLSIKCTYARNAGLAGVMIWALGQDIVGGGQPLMEAVGKTMNLPTYVADQRELPLGPRLEQNYPNPFNGSTMIRYALPRRGDVRIAVYSILGQKVADLLQATQEAGIHEARFDAAGLASGVYLCRLSTPDATRSIKIILLR